MKSLQFVQKWLHEQLTQSTNESACNVCGSGMAYLREIDMGCGCGGKKSGRKGGKGGTKCR